MNGHASPLEHTVKLYCRGFSRELGSYITFCSALAVSSLYIKDKNLLAERLPENRACFFIVDKGIEGCSFCWNQNRSSGTCVALCVCRLKCEERSVRKCGSFVLTSEVFNVTSELLSDIKCTQRENFGTNCEKIMTQSLRKLPRFIKVTVRCFTHTSVLRQVVVFWVGP